MRKRILIFAAAIGLAWFARKATREGGWKGKVAPYAEKASHKLRRGAMGKAA